MLGPGQTLLDLAARSEDELLLVAPYVKVGALERVLKARQPESGFRVVTRWRLEELASGVSDIAVYPLVQAHGGTLDIHPTLHAKYYASGRHALVGSANLTAAALGWRSDSNLEILVDNISGRLQAFEQVLNASAVPVDDALYRNFRDALTAFPPTAISPAVDDKVPSFMSWRPTLRHPEDLYVAYSGGPELLSTSSRQAAATDLDALGPPLGMNRTQLRLWVAMQLRQHPELLVIDKFACRSRRFGEMTALLSKRGVQNADRAWQTWMRWLLYFLSNEYSVSVANYSEIFSRLNPLSPPTVEHRAK